MPLVGCESAIFFAPAASKTVYSKGKMPLKSGENWAPDRSDFGEGVFIFLRFGGFQNPWGVFIFLRFPQIFRRGVFIKGGGYF